MMQNNSATKPKDLKTIDNIPLIYVCKQDSATLIGNSFQAVKALFFTYQMQSKQQTNQPNS